jgi:hypothetical protein
VKATLCEEIADLYRKCPDMDFEADVWYYQRYGHIIWTDRLFALFEKRGMGWFLHCVVSLNGIKDLFQWMPYWLPFIGWARYSKGRKQIKWYDTCKIMRYYDKE